MCGIIGYIGKRPAFPILLSGLKKLLYRGYDSFGFSVIDRENNIRVFKRPGKLDEWEGKLDGLNFEGNIGIAHCLTPDTLVQLADGRIVEISSIVDGDKVLSLNPKTFKFEEGEAKIFKHKSPEYIYEIKTPSVSFKTTGAHKMLVFLDGGIKEKKIEDLSENDLLIFSKQIKIKGKKIKFEEVEVKRYYKIANEMGRLIQNRLFERELSIVKAASSIGISESYLEHIVRNDRNFREDQLQKVLPFFSIDFSSEYIVPQDSTQGKFINLPKESSSELMQIIGYFLGDGGLQLRSVRFKDTRKEVLGIYKKLIEKVFNLKGRVVPQKGTIAYLLEVNSLYLRNWLRENVVLRKKELLEELGQLPEEEIAAFLRGIFDAEGTVGMKAKQISLSITDKKIAQITQFLLSRFGILSSLSLSKRKESNWNDAYRISLSNYDSIGKFLDRIGFSSSEKRKKSEAILNKTRKGSAISFKILPFPKYEIYNILSDYVKKTELRKFLGKGKNLNNFITEWNLIKFTEYLTQKYQNNPRVVNAVGQFKRIVGGDIVFQKIIEAKKIKSPHSYLYDLEVNPHSNFFANGLLSHNSRWATHGGVTVANAHPHWDCDRNIFLAHNGIIENYKELKEKLEREGHKFNSECDTEVISHLIEKHFAGNLEEAVRRALKDIRGTYGIVAISKNDPSKIVTAKLSSPLIVGVNPDEFLVASDAAAIITHTRQIINLDDNEIAVLKPDNYFIIKEKPLVQIEWTAEETEKGGYPHFMLKEIMEQPESIKNSLGGRLLAEEGMVKLGGLVPVQNKLREIKRLNIIACGTSYHAGLIGEYMLEEYAGLPTEVDFASEFRYRKPILDKNSAFLFVSQSGETADTLAALKEIKEKSGLTLGMVNVVGSSISRETDAGVYNHAGPEIGVASTKSFTSQLAIFALLTLFLGRQREMSLVTGRRIIQELSKIPDLVKKTLELNPKIKELAEKYKDFNNFLYLGRKYNFPVALEGALKLKEISYIHAEGYGAGEMKHGPIALIDENFPTVAIAPTDSVYEKIISNLEEIKARNGPILVVATEGNEEIKKLADDVIYIPKTLEMLTPILSVIPLQLFAYHVGVLRGCDVDKPRNLAKSVTVE